MEQRIGSSSEPLKGEPVKGAGFDPAYIPGLTAPAAQPRDAGPQDAVPQDAPEPATGTPGDPTAEAATDEPADLAATPPEGPVFEAGDRRAKFAADHRGVRLSLDEESCEFGWDEIAAVETESPRFGKRFTITVHTPERRWYPIEIEAPARSSFKQWESELDAVLDAYFEEGSA
ncbi:hypothetical protein AQJ66_12540 [Streptomyces bungoensis]|uniref:Uncharacterized protein n=1 Tax=Streptomyces bungoensis TaxID=285568 RepID=A0A101T4T6_9ACTN|nr:hypothetical protein [Streptomyces bungoensis]KUN85779.1 hypothetical protein AQJ66_12540 [Streptomyces bungoensis]